MHTVFNGCGLLWSRERTTDMFCVNGGCGSPLLTLEVQAMPGASFVLLPEAPEAPASRQMAPLVHLQPAQASPDALP